MLAFFKRQSFTRELIFGAFEFTATFFMLNAFKNAIHEWCHLSVLQYFGGDGYIIKDFWSVGVHFTKMPSNVSVVAFAGGIGTALFFLVLMYLDWDDDPETAAAFPPLILSQLLYGVTEGLWIFGNPDLFNQYAGMASTLGSGIGFAISMYLILKWLIRLDQKYKRIATKKIY